MRHKEKHSETKLAVSYSGSPVIFTSLYMVMLCFFILLNVISEKSTFKEQQTISGVLSAFSGHDGMFEDVKSPDNIMHFDYIVDLAFTDTKLMVKSLFSHDYAQINRKNNKLAIDIAMQSFFKENSSEIKSEKSLLIKRLSQIMQTRLLLVDFAVKLSILTDSRKELPVVRGAAIAQHLNALGVTKRQIGLYLENTPEDIIRIEITILPKNHAG